MKLPESRRAEWPREARSFVILGNRTSLLCCASRDGHSRKQPQEIHALYALVFLLLDVDFRQIRAENSRHNFAATSVESADQMPMNLGSRFYIGLLYERLSDSRTDLRQVFPQIVRRSSGHHTQRDTVKVNSHLAAGDATHVDDAPALL